MRACSLGLVGLGFRIRDKVRVSVRNRVGVRVSTFYFPCPAPDLQLTGDHSRG